MNEIVPLIFVLGAALLVVYYHHQRVVEGFGPNDWRPCAVYFTDDRENCDAGAYRYPPIYYENKLRILNEAIRARGGTPSNAQNTEKIRLQTILDNYRKLPNQRYCKIDIPNWKQYAPRPDIPYLSKDRHNAERGQTKDWAFCWRSRADNASLGRTGMVLENVAGKYQGETIDGEFRVRGTFDEAMSPDGVRRTYCEETRNTVRPYVLRAGFIGRGAERTPDGMPTTYGLVKNNAVQGAVSDNDVAQYFGNALFYQRRVREGSNDSTYAYPSPRTYRIVKLARDPCNRLVEDYSTFGRLEFTEPILLSRTYAGTNFLHGTIPELRQRSYDKRNYINNLRNYIYSLVQYLMSLFARVGYLEWRFWVTSMSRNHYENLLNLCRRGLFWLNWVA